MHCHCGTNNRATRWTFKDPCKPEVRPGAPEEVLQGKVTIKLTRSLTSMAFERVSLEEYANKVSFPYHSTVMSKVFLFFFTYITQTIDPSFLLAVNSDELSALSNLDWDVSAASWTCTNEKLQSFSIKPHFVSIFKFVSLSFQTKISLYNVKLHVYERDCMSHLHLILFSLEWEVVR